MSKSENFDELAKKLADIESLDPFLNTKCLLAYKDYQIKNLKEELAELETKLTIANNKVKVKEEIYAASQKFANFVGGVWEDFVYNGYGQLEHGKKYYVMANGKMMRMRWINYDWEYKGQIHLGITHWLNVTPLQQYKAEYSNHGRTVVKDYFEDEDD